MRSIRALCMTGAILVAAQTATAAPREMSVQVRETQVRATPSFLGKVVGTAAYGDRVTVEASSGPWTRVAGAAGRPAGWLHSSALTPKRIKLAAGDEDVKVAASSGELALAGKGFNSDVEAEFKSRNRAADFKAVDRIESYTVTLPEMEAFLKQGKVEPKGGAQ